MILQAFVEQDEAAMMEYSPDSDASPSPPSSEQRRSCVCDICGAKLSRPAHLQRHMKRHSTAVVKSFHCQLCGRSFSRKDVYQRHKRSVHDPNPANRPEGRRKSCQRCIRYKLRCSREVPCTACRNRPEPCVYNKPVDNASHAAADGGVDVRAPNLDDLAHAANLSHESSLATHEMVPAPMEEDATTLNQRVPHDPTSVSNIDPALADATSYTADHRGFSFGPSPGVPGSGLLPPSFSLEIPMPHSSDTDDGRDGNTEFDNLLPEAPRHRDQPDPAQQDMASWFDFQLDPFQIDLYGWDTLLGCETEPELGSPSVSLGMSAQDTIERPQTSRFSAYSGSQSSPKDVAVRSDGNTPHRRSQRHANVQSASKHVENKEYWPGVLDQGGNETWPFDYTSNKGFRRIKLPPLKDVLEQTVACRPSIQKSILGDLIKVLSAPQIPSLNDTPALEAMPAVAFLGEFTRVYFSEFHNFCPVIHVPTWRIEKCPTPLLAAMACIGATYSTAEGSSELSALFAEITQRALFWTGQQDSSAFRNTAYITASCFHQIYALGTGNRRLYEIADASRGLLVTSLRGLGVLSSEGSSSASESLGLDFQKLKSMTSQELDEAWGQWRDKETAKRMAWSVFEFDCTMSTMTSKRAAFRIAELPSRLPCSDSIWEAHSARAWAALVPFATSSPAGLPFYPVLREMIASGKVPNHAPSWAVRLCAVAIGRILYDMKEVQDASAPGVLGLPTMADAHAETRQRLLSSLGALEVSLSKPMCTADVVNMNVLSLAYHRSHLISSGDETMDLVITIFRSSGIDSNTQNTSSRSVEAAKDRLQHIFRNNPSGTRRLVFHAAVIVAIARDCTINTPCETLSVFIGYALLLSYMKYFPFAKDNQIRGSTVLVRLDEIPWMREAQAMRQIERWIAHGGPASLSGIDNICDKSSLSAAKQGALDALAELSVWGLARKFRQTVAKFS